MKCVLITGAAGFIGYHCSLKMINEGYMVIGLDSMNDYYDVSLKEKRLSILREHNHFMFSKTDITDFESLENIFREFKFDDVIHLAAQAGVRHSVIHPELYLKVNIEGFFNVLKLSVLYHVKHFIYASSSSVYGNSKTTDKPVSVYAATKKTDELLSYAYSSLYRLPTTGLRFFTVYGPFGRPDMAYYSFTEAISHDKEITVFNQGDSLRDFTYVDDAVDGIFKAVNSPPDEDTPYQVFDIGSHHPVTVSYLVSLIEEKLGKKAKIIYAPMEKGDVFETDADTDAAKEKIGYCPKTSIEEGMTKFINWYQKK